MGAKKVKVKKQGKLEITEWQTAPQEFQTTIRLTCPYCGTVNDIRSWAPWVKCFKCTRTTVVK